MTENGQSITKDMSLGARERLAGSNLAFLFLMSSLYWNYKLALLLA